MSILLSGKLKTLIDRLTSTRAANLDEVTAARMARLDADISSRTAAATWTATKAGYLDAAVTSRASATDLATVDTVVDTIYARQFGFRPPTVSKTYTTTASNYFPAELQPSANAVHGGDHTTGVVPASNAGFISITGPVVVLACGIVNRDAVSESGAYVTLAIDGNTVASVENATVAADRGLIFNGGVVDSSGNFVLHPLPWIVTTSLTMTGYCADTLGADLRGFVYYIGV